MSQLKVDSSKLIAALKGISNELDSVISSSLDTLAEIGASNARSSRLFKNRSGTLRREIKFTRDGEMARRVIADTNYAGYVEFGNRPGGTGQRIYPKRAKALRFEVDGKVIFRKWVRSHGPLPFMGKARDLMVSFIPDLFENNLGRLFQKHSRG